MHGVVCFRGSVTLGRTQPETLSLFPICATRSVPGYWLLYTVAFPPPEQQLDMSGTGELVFCLCPPKSTHPPPFFLMYLFIQISSPSLPPPGRLRPPPLEVVPGRPLTSPPLPPSVSLRRLLSCLLG